MKHVKDALGKVASRIHDREKDLYRLTPDEAAHIEIALRIRAEADEENEDYEGAAIWRKIWRKFVL